MGLSKFSTRYNVLTITSIQSFANIKGGLNHGCKDVYFIRGVGCGPTYVSDILNMDRQLADREKKGQGRYIRVREFPGLSDPADIAFYAGVMENWEKGGEREIISKRTGHNSILQTVMSQAVKTVLARFRQQSSYLSKTMERNFGIKLLFWIDSVAGRFLDGWSENNSDKFVYSGNIKKQEYLFCYFLTLLGIDVLMLPAGIDMDGKRELLMLSGVLALGDAAPVPVPPYHAAEYGKEETPVRPPAAVRNRAVSTAAEAVRRDPRPPSYSGKSGQELAFEELAQLASSVVMITVHDREGKIISGGSGIMVGAKGYILTNSHVASKGVFYSVHMEEDETPYRTDEVIKYNQLLDLAVIRISRTLTPIPVFKGQKPLVRGQKVVAIGSPLGLFNSVSDGIISGFRRINEVDMIQFTAPISPGSSGGALLNMYGEIIGISTAGIDQGQNINLAVDYRCIAEFIRGFI